MSSYQTDDVLVPPGARYLTRPGVTYIPAPASVPEAPPPQTTGPPPAAPPPAKPPKHPTQPHQAATADRKIPSPSPVYTSTATHRDEEPSIPYKATAFRPTSKAHPNAALALLAHQHGGLVAEPLRALASTSSVAAARHQQNPTSAHAGPNNPRKAEDHHTRSLSHAHARQPAPIAPGADPQTVNQSRTSRTEGRSASHSLMLRRNGPIAKVAANIVQPLVARGNHESDVFGLWHGPLHHIGDLVHEVSRFGRAVEHSSERAGRWVTHRIESDRALRLDIEYARTLSRAVKAHPDVALTLAVLLAPEGGATVALVLLADAVSARAAVKAIHRHDYAEAGLDLASLSAGLGSGLSTLLRRVPEAKIIREESSIRKVFREAQTGPLEGPSLTDTQMHTLATSIGQRRRYVLGSEALLHTANSADRAAALFAILALDPGLLNSVIASHK